MSSTARTAPEKSAARPVPEGYHTATPYLVVRNAAAAIEFYQKAFGARELMRLAQPDGRIGHAEIKVGDSVIMLSDEFPEYGNRSPQSLGGTSALVALYVEDVDAVAQEAVTAGAQVVIPVSDQFYGDRSGRLADPFGHLWIISTHKEDVPPAEIERRAAAYMKEMEAKQKAATAAVKPIPEGYNTVTPYLTIRQANRLIEFVKEAFGARETFRTPGSRRGLHAEVRIDDSRVMIGGEPPEGMPWNDIPAALHLYVTDADAVYRKALAAGATSIREPVDQPYGDREASVRDPFGNTWYIATHKLTGRHIPEGLRAVTPYFHPRGAARLIDFLKQAFQAEEVARYAAPDGTIQHAEVRIGDSMIEMGEAHGAYQPAPPAIYLYVPDVDATYERALRAGAIGVKPPTDQPYGDRNAHVTDPFGNTWYIATHIGLPPAAQA